MGNDAGVRRCARNSYESAGVDGLHELSQQWSATTRCRDRQQVFRTALSAWRDHVPTLSWMGRRAWGKFAEPRVFEREFKDDQSREVAAGTAGRDLHGVSLRGNGGGAATGEGTLPVSAGRAAGGLHSLFLAQRKSAAEGGGAEPVRSAVAERVPAEVGGQDVVRKLSRSPCRAGRGAEGGVLPRQMSELSWRGICGEASSRQTGLYEMPHAGAAEQGCGAHGGHRPPDFEVSPGRAGAAAAGARDAGGASGVLSQERRIACDCAGLRAGLGDFSPTECGGRWAGSGAVSAQGGDGAEGWSSAAIGA